MRLALPRPGSAPTLGMALLALLLALVQEVDLDRQLPAHVVEQHATDTSPLLG